MNESTNAINTTTKLKIDHNQLHQTKSTKARKKLTTGDQNNIYNSSIRLDIFDSLGLGVYFADVIAD